MTDEEFEEMWAKTKESDEWELNRNLWNSLTIEEKETFVKEQEELSASSDIWEDFSEEPETEDCYSPEQRE